MEISVIVPTYKPKGYLTKCLQSLTAQTLSHEKYEIIIILNGCNEPFYTFIKEVIGKYPSDIHITLYQTDTSGVSNARNIGIEHAKGTYIFFIDDDDWVSDNYLENLLIHTENHSIVVSNVIQIDDSTGLPIDYFLTQAYEKNKNETNPSFLKARSFLSTACGKLIPRTYSSTDRFHLKHKLGEDSLFLFLISKLIKLISLASEDTIYYVRKRNNSASHCPYPYSYRIHVALELTVSYCKIYLRNIKHYNFLFFLTRIAATLRKIFQSHYE